MSSLLTLTVLFGFMGGDVAWLAEVTKPPVAISVESAGKMQPLFERANGQPIRTREDWQARRTELRTKWLEFLGPMPTRPTSGFTELKTEELERVQRIRIRYECEPGLFVEAYLLKPKGGPTGPRSRPALVALHQTTNATIDEIAGVGGAGQQAIGLQLAERGFVVICPRNFLWENVPNLNAAVDQFKQRHPKALGMHKMLYDAQRATDLLAHVPEVDPQRIGSVGHSLGAKEVLYLAALDERIRATVASEGGITFRSTNWDAPWYLGRGIREADFERNHHELLALTAPRAFLVMGGEQGPGAADGNRSWPLITAAQPAYSMQETPIRLGLLNHGKGHSIPPDAFEKMAQWLETYLAPVVP